MHVESFLADRGVHYEILEHRPTDTAVETSAASGIPAEQMAKVVLLRADHGFEYVIAVVPADQDLDLEKASHALGESDLALAGDQEVAQRCPDCEDRILLPFGAAYNLKCLVDDSFVQRGQIVFRCNTRDHSVRMSFEDFRNLEKPPVVAISK